MEEHVSLATLEGDVVGPHWNALRALLPAYRSITTVEIGDGRHTDFWEDTWLDSVPLSSAYPALRSHVHKEGATVREMLERGVQHWLVPRLSTVATLELDSLSGLIAQVQLSEEADARTCPLVDVTGKLRSSSIYRLQTSGNQCDFFGFVWKNRAPPKVQMFAWLLVQGRIQCKSNLLFKHIVDNDTCDLCRSAPETPDHIISQCPFAQSFWSHHHAPHPATR